MGRDCCCWLTLASVGGLAVAHSAESAPNLSKNGFATKQIMTRKAPTSCNHVCMDAMQDKQKSIGDEWAVIAVAGSLWPLWVGWQQ